MMMLWPVVMAFEVLEVGWQVAQELPVSADCTVGVDGYDSR